MRHQFCRSHYWTVLIAIGLLSFAGCGRYSTANIPADILAKASDIIETEKEYVQKCEYVGKISLTDNEVDAWNLKPKLYQLLASASKRGATHVVYQAKSIQGVAGACYNCSRQKAAYMPSPKRIPGGSKAAVNQNDPILASTRKWPNSWAVIIGVSRYQYSGSSGLTNLIFADDDAKAFARALMNLGWRKSHMNVLINEAATKRKITIALRSWLSKAGPDDQVILFWAGHGYADPEDPEKVYLATYDTDLAIPVTGYRMDEVRRALEEIGPKNIVLLADTCHAGKLITRSSNKRGISIVANVKNQKVPKGWIFMVGADTDRQAIEHTTWTNGAFTHSLIQGLNGAADGFLSAGAKDGMVTMGELKDYMKTSMPDETQKVLGVAKHPVIATSTGDPDIWNLTLQKTNGADVQ